MKTETRARATLYSASNIVATIAIAIVIIVVIVAAETINVSINTRIGLLVSSSLPHIIPVSDAPDFLCFCVFVLFILQLLEY